MVVPSVATMNGSGSGSGASSNRNIIFHFESWSASVNGSTSYLSAMSSALMWIMYFHFSISWNLFPLFSSFPGSGSSCTRTSASGDDDWLRDAVEKLDRCKNDQTRRAKKFGKKRTATTDKCICTRMGRAATNDTEFFCSSNLIFCCLCCCCSLCHSLHWAELKIPKLVGINVFSIEIIGKSAQLQYFNWSKNYIDHRKWRRLFMGSIGRRGSSISPFLALREKRWRKDATELIRKFIRCRKLSATASRA